MNTSSNIHMVNIKSGSAKEVRSRTRQKANMNAASPLFKMDVMLVKVEVNGVKLNDLPLNNHVTLQITFTPADISDVEGMEKCKAVIKEGVLHLAGPNQIAILVVNKTTKHFKGMFSVHPSQNGPSFPCDIQEGFDDSHIKWQLHALSEISKNPRWNQPFVNEDASVEAPNSPDVTFKKCTDEQKMKIFKQEINRAGLKQGQKAAAAKACFSHNAGAAAIKAAAGTGKTRVSSVIANFFLRIGAHVMCIGTSNPAADALYADIEDLQ